jgi:putative transcriptional regulator
VSDRIDLYDATMLDYATGALPASAAMVVSAHLRMRPAALAAVRSFDRIGGALFDVDAPVAEMRADAASVLARAASTGEEPHPGLRNAARLSALLDNPEAGRWRFVLPGMAERRIEGVKDTSLIRLRAGRTVPEHDHEGLEVTLILAGAFADEYGEYGRGDLVIRDPSTRHRPQVPQGEDCICLAATIGVIRPTSLAARLAQRLFA